MKKVKSFFKKTMSKLLVVKKINFKLLVLNAIEYVKLKSWLLTEKEFWFIFAIFIFSLFSIPNFDNIVFTVIRLLFVLMLTTYMLYQVYLFSNEGIKMKGFRVEFDNQWYWSDRFWWFSLYIYLSVLLVSINLYFYVMPLFFVFLKRICEKKYK